jgi:hypothetical protein
MSVFMAHVSNWIQLVKKTLRKIDSAIHGIIYILLAAFAVNRTCQLRQ